MSILAASLAAATFGAGDFLGGVAARDSDWRQVVSVALGVGLLVLGAAACFGGGPAGTLPMAWCLSAGTGFARVSLLYRALAEGQMTQVAPLTAAVAIAVPAFVDILAGKAVTGPLVLGLVAAGFSAAFLSGLVGGWRDGLRNRSTLMVALGAGLGLALFYIGLDRVEVAGGGIRGLLLVRATAFVATAAVTLRCRGGALHPRSLGIAAGAGVLDGTANLLLMMAFATGGLAETSAIASLYPVATIVLAIAVLRERPSRSQAIGLLLVIPAIFLLKST
ncbi:EamA family transporter [Mesorhizobium sangaii]|uniref:Putative membrane protein n=1 Tax=Mesorhizobium sangaii TaxID=505389 RepID=A0A841PJP2_9HYPH|nr:EamA family transporter [Mesorhizobium sangaii]MBB6413853.1 putative membrane protein [Mesorhizobium sangaii]